MNNPLFLKFPYSVSDNVQVCAVCKIPILNVYEPYLNKYYPSSLYWSVEREEVYCSPDHSLIRHEEIKDV